MSNVEILIPSKIKPVNYSINLQQTQNLQFSLMANRFSVIKILFWTMQ